jgi:class 3 adenylate cyclase
MDFDAVLAQVHELLQRQGRVSYRALRLRFQLDDEALAALQAELIYAERVARDEEDWVLVWIGEASTASEPAGRFSPALPPDEPRAPDSERRQLTVMFCDLVDSTALASQLDPEDWRAVVRAYQEACAKVIAHFEGHIAQYLGDGLLIYFGYPQAHEGDAQRAVRACLGMVEAMSTCNALLTPTRGFRLAIRVGIHTGLVVVGEMGGGSRHEQLALGDTPNVAAHLQGLAAPNTVVISAATYHLVQGYFTMAALGPQVLKGVASPVPVYRILGVSAAQSRLEVASSTSLTPLVGHEAEVALLLERWTQSQAGQGQVVLLSGEAGIGKSRLVEVLREQVAREGHAPITFRCSLYHTHSPLYPIIEQLQGRLQLYPDDAPEAKLDKLEQGLQGYHFSHGEMVPLLALLLSVPLLDRYLPVHQTPQWQRQQTLEAVVAWLLEEADRQPVLAVWEYVHWADPSTLEYSISSSRRPPPHACSR